VGKVGELIGFDGRPVWVGEKFGKFFEILLRVLNSFGGIDCSSITDGSSVNSTSSGEAFLSDQLSSNSPQFKTCSSNSPQSNINSTPTNLDSLQSPAKLEIAPMRLSRKASDIRCSNQLFIASTFNNGQPKYFFERNCAGNVLKMHKIIACIMFHYT
jgi:hypothetical protein